LALVDAIFGQPQVFGDEFLHLEAAGAVNATVDPMFGPDGPARIAVSVFQNDASHATVSSDEASRRCAREVADRFAQLRDAGARPGEMALLLGSMTRASFYQEALRDAGFESIVAGGSGFGQSAEAQLVAMLLRLAVNRDDAEALYPVLVSSLFAISDDVLLALATTDAWAAGDENGYPRQSIARGFFGREEDDAFPLSEEDRAALALTRRCLRSFVRHAVREGAASALRRLFADSGLADRLQLEGANGMARAGNFNKACVIVEGLERDGCGIADVSRRYSDYIALAKEAPGALTCLDADFVRIMTVHTSKGLEFPHVAVAELKDGYPGGSAPSFFVENIGEATYVAAAWMPHGSWDKTATKLRSWARALDEEGPAVPMEEPAEAERAFCTLPAARFGAALATYSAVQEREEARRLMYVALTRASRSLQLVMRVSAKPEDGYGDTWVTGDVFDALGWPMGEGASISMVDFGGRAPARVTAERLLVEMQDDEMGEGEGALAGEEKVEDRGSDGARGQRADEGIVSETAATDISPVFLVPLREHAEDPVLVPRNFAREGLYSYTSLSGAHPHSDEAAVDTDEGLVLVDSEGAAVASEYRASTGRGALPGSESATALGTAFHRLAQQAIELSERGALFCPGEAAVEAQIQKESLSAGQQERLYRALTRWLGSDEAVRFASYEHRRAEVPFTVALGGFFLEGEIDGLADNGDGAAFLIDYKTGGRDDETPEQLDEKHRLQASCYAYALMRAGYESVEAHFLRIERPGTDNPRDPQIVPYHFEKTDLPALEALIIAKQREASV
ncbi:PD-(D/E)XK nuclease family protein, partial [Adlercreutzia equolifaciens]|uniref:PD-(D/E)XK nuclease family protein n=1 Tax=Adlercreutzia equolifaciens TaxID=446660 RepID=UPI003A95C4CF